MIFDPIYLLFIGPPLLLSSLLPLSCLWINWAPPVPLFISVHSVLQLCLLQFAVSCLQAHSAAPRSRWPCVVCG